MSTHARTCPLLVLVVVMGAALSAHANTPITPHVWRIQLHAGDLEHREVRATLDLSAQHGRAQLGASLSDSEIARYVRDRLHLRHQHTTCRTVDFQGVPRREASPDLIQFEMRIRCEEDIVFSDLVASSTLFAAQHHPIPTLLEIVDLSTQPANIIARATFDSVHMTYPEQPARPPPVRRAPRVKPTPARSPWYALAGIMLFLLVCGALWFYRGRSSTTTR